MDILEFLTARYDEKETAARALDFQRIEATDGPWDSKYLTLHKADGAVLHTSELPADLADHVVRHDPVSVLADLAAKRRMVDPNEWAGGPETEDAYQDMLRFLALPFAGHPDYEVAWAI